LHHYGAGTHVGNIRDNNEDSYVCDSQKELWIVADGMGGLGFGEVASAITTFTVTTMIRDGHGVNQAIEQAHARIKAYAETEGKGISMGTTIVLLLSRQNLYRIFWVGDSRAYLLDEDKFNQITVDHSVVQSLIEKGELTVEEARSDSRKNVVTRALGLRGLETVRADSISNKWSPKQKVLLCSDGLTDSISNAGIESILRHEGTDQELSDRLIAAALEGGGRDNITAIVISADESIRHSDVDTDTHVPLDAKVDEINSPVFDDATANRDSGDRPDLEFTSNPSVTIGTQLTLAIPEILPDGPALSESGVKIASPLPVFRIWATAFAVILIVIVLLFYVGLTTSNSTERATKPAMFSQQQDISRQAELVFPPIDLPANGAIIQVGIFALLKSAEEEQLRLVRLGLEPYIQKRSTGEGILYSVLLGPLSPQTYRTTTATLTSNNLSFFHRPSRSF